jgi:hypothetical protein
MTKPNYKTTFVIFLQLIILMSCSGNKEKKDTFEAQIGSYRLDTKRTNLGKYKNDSALYAQLTISFLHDSTFFMNMYVPFFADSLGTWIAGDGSPYDYNQLFFKNVDYGTVQGTQFFPPYSDSGDIIFFMNGSLPSKNMTPIQKIYFKKIDR